MTVFEIMDYFAALNGIKKNGNKRKERNEKLLEMTHLSDKSDVK